MALSSARKMYAGWIRLQTVYGLPIVSRETANIIFTFRPKSKIHHSQNGWRSELLYPIRHTGLSNPNPNPSMAFSVSTPIHSSIKTARPISTGPAADVYTWPSFKKTCWNLLLNRRKLRDCPKDSRKARIFLKETAFTILPFPM